MVLFREPEKSSNWFTCYGWVYHWIIMCIGKVCILQLTFLRSSTRNVVNFFLHHFSVICTLRGSPMSLLSKMLRMIACNVCHWLCTMSFCTDNYIVLIVCINCILFSNVLTWRVSSSTSRISDVKNFVARLVWSWFCRGTINHSVLLYIFGFTCVHYPHTSFSRCIYLKNHL